MGGSSTQKDKDGPPASTAPDKTAKSSSAKTVPSRAASKPEKSDSNKSEGGVSAEMISKILSGLADIQSRQKASDENMSKLVSRMDYFEEWAGGDEEEGQYEQEEGEIDIDLSSPPLKRQKTEESRFSLMSRRLKGFEKSGPPLEETLASNINDVFVNGLKEDEYTNMIKEESLPRPENCTALQTVKCNKMVWDILPANSKYLDRKLQNTETSVIKAATLIGQAVDNIAKAEIQIKDLGIDISAPLDSCQDALSLLGHANKQINMARREALRPELRRPYSHLCSSSQPFNEWLFGDIEKAAKEIEDTAKIGSKLQHEGNNRPGYNKRPVFRGRFMRGRGNARPSQSYGKGYSASPDSKKRATERPPSLQETINDSPYRPLHSEDQDGQSRLLGDFSFMADSTLVAPHDGNTCTNSLDSAEKERTTQINSYRQAASSRPTPSTSGMQTVRESFKGRGFSKTATRVLMASWRSSTKREYEVYIQRWISFCNKQKIDKVSVSINDIVEFLTEEYNRGDGYSAINTARSALSSMGIFIDRYPAGSHPLVVRFLRGVFHLRRPNVRYTHIWNVDPVLRYLQKLSPVKHLSLKDLTFKLVMLIALVNAARVHTIQLLTVKGYRKLPSEFIFLCDSLLKQNRPSYNVSALHLKSYPPDRRLCVYFVMKEYLKRTKDLRKGTDKLLISYRKPHGAISRDTIARWIKTVMSRAGIDIRKFTAHSVRAAVTSKAKQTIPVEKIMEKAGWSNKSTFAKYYDKTIQTTDELPEAVLHLQQ